MIMCMLTLHYVHQIRKRRDLWYSRMKKMICSSGLKDIGRIISVVSLITLAPCIRLILMYV